jgi:hypothetical protein
MLAPVVDDVLAITVFGWNALTAVPPMSHLAIGSTVHIDTFFVAVAVPAVIALLRMAGQRCERRDGQHQRHQQLGLLHGLAP